MESCPRCRSPTGGPVTTWPPTLSSLGVPGHRGDLEGTPREQSQPAGSWQNQRGLPIAAPPAHRAHSWTWAETGRAPGQHYPEPGVWSTGWDSVGIFQETGMQPEVAGKSFGLSAFPGQTGPLMSGASFPTQGLSLLISMWWTWAP